MCGVVGVYTSKLAAAPLVLRALHALQHRGQEAAGIVSVDDNGRLEELRGRGLVEKAVPTPLALALAGNRAVGHARYSTVARDHADNVQPFVTSTPFGTLALCHNGNLKNAPRLLRELVQQGVVLKTTMDTELLAHLLCRASASDFSTALAQAMGCAVGAYTLTMLVGNRLFGLRDPHGLRPLVLGRLPQGQGMVLASETCALQTLEAEYLREVAPGELIEIGPAGWQSTQLLPPKKPAPCVFELVYFARPSSQVFGQSVQSARLRMGEELARLDQSFSGPRPDVVVPIPQSGMDAAIGYARESGLPLDEAITCSDEYSHLRTFIQPKPAAREQGVRGKFSQVRNTLFGKRVLLVDDSLVRGHTARQLVQQVRAAGARAVSMRIASPPIAWPCYLGIDMPSRTELIINQQGSLAEVARHIGVEDLRYLDLEGLRRAVGGAAFCMGCMTGRYPV